MSVDDDPVDRAVAELKQITRTRALELALAIGEIVFRHVYRGDVELLRRNGRKDVSFQRLVARRDLELSRATLYRAVAIYELSLRFPHIRQSKHLGVSHLRAVLGLPPRTQAKLLERAEREHMDVATLEGEATSNRKGRGGRPRKPEILKALDCLRHVASLPCAAFSDPRSVESLSREDIECAAETLRDVEDRLTMLSRLFRNAGASG